MIPIRCGGINLPHVLQNLVATRGSFLMKYLGSPFRCGNSKRWTFNFLWIRWPPSWFLGRSEHNLHWPYNPCKVGAIIPNGLLQHLAHRPIVHSPQCQQARAAFLWAGTNKTTVAKCKVNWDPVCRPLCFGRLGMLNTDKFARALRLRWFLFKWKESIIGMGNTCDALFFYASTTITVDIGAHTPFWDAPCLLRYMIVNPRTLSP